MAGVSLEAGDGVARLTLDRPQAMNAIDEDVLAGLRQSIDALREDTAIKALVITGAGDAFCVGLDLNLLGRAFDDLDYFRDVVTRLKDLLLDLEHLPFPVVAAVNGLARAGGFELILACDLAVIADEARVADHHITFGILPGGGATQRAPRKLGQQRARELLYTGRWLRGTEAVEAGLALRSVPRARLGAAIDELVDPLRSHSRPCLAAMKAAVRDGAELPLPDALDLELERFISFLANEPTSKEGYLAYVDGRKPAWP